MILGERTLPAIKYALEKMWSISQTLASTSISPSKGQRGLLRSLHSDPKR
jgi:hypothetical protein